MSGLNSARRASAVENFKTLVSETDDHAALYRVAIRDATRSWEVLWDGLTKGKPIARHQIAGIIAIRTRNDGLRFTQLILRA